MLAVYGVLIRASRVIHCGIYDMSILCIMADEMEQCPCCKKVYKSKRYLKCHLAYPSNSRCKAVWEGRVLGNLDHSSAAGSKRAHEALNAPSDGNESDCDDFVSCESLSLSSDGSARKSDHDSCVFTLPVDDKEEDNEYGTYDFDEEDGKQEEDEEGGDSPDTTIMHELKDYIAHFSSHTCNLTPDDRAGIELLDILIKQRAPMRIFDDIYRWHTSNLEATKSGTSKESLLKLLEERYGMEKQQPKVISKLILPHSKAEVDLVYHDFLSQVKSLLIDPRISDEDYLFFNNDPFGPPPSHFSTISDINTGLAYRETHKKLIKKPGKQVLLPIIMYIDAAVTGQYDHLPIEALKFTLGIFNATTRDKDYAWRSLGYVTKFLTEETKAKSILVNSGGVDGTDYLSDDSSDAEYTAANVHESVLNSDNSEDECELLDNADDENLDPVKKVPSCSAQDLHAMLDALMSSYREVEKDGFMWNLRYRGRHYLVEFVPFILFVKGDTQEHDKHCGKYTSRGKNVQNLCRYCCVPNDDTDDPKASNFSRKSPRMVQELVNVGDLEGLKAISQQYFTNCWYKVRFGQHNDYGIHGACPLEVLHWLQIGKYGYVRDMFFDQLGQTSALADELNAIARALGKLFKRQSDRDLPRLNFTKGIRRGKLMAHEMSGMMVVLVACLRCTKGRRLLLNESRGKSKTFFGNLNLINDWILLLETLLQWEAWMKEPEMTVFDVQRARIKIPEIMEMEKYVGQRSGGMQFKVFKFHASLHLPDDILSFGVPAHVNTQSDESHHKKSKTAAIHTQRRMKSFCIQTARNLHSMDIVDAGMQEIRNGRVPWDYYYEDEDDNDVQATDEDSFTGDRNDDHVEVINTGTNLNFFYSLDSDEYVYTVNSQMKNKHKFILDEQLIAFIGNVLDQIRDDNVVQSFRLFTEHKRNGVIFRGTPYLYDKPWRDWVIIDWGTQGKLPAQIHIFIDLRNIPEDSAYIPGTYAVIESAKPNSSAQERKIDSDLFQAFLKEHKGISASGGIRRKFHLVDTNSFYEPATLIPDLGNPNKAAFLRLHPRSMWKDLFIRWLRRPRQEREKHSN